MTALQAEAIVTWAYAAGFGLSTIPVAIYLGRVGRLPAFFGLFEMYAGPWWTRGDHGSFVRLLLAFFVVALVAAYAAWLVWRASKPGAVLTLVVLPIEATFWHGFDLPIPKMLGLARVVLLVLGWSALT